MSPESDEIRQLRENLAQLTRRVYRIEQAAKAAGVVLDDANPVAEERSAPVSAPPPGIAPVAADAGAGMPPARIPVFEAPSFGAERRPSSEQGLESMIGSQWLNRIGIVAVLVGVSYFLKYAFENNWIGPSGRIAIGLLAGIAVVVWSERFRGRGYRVFSFSLKAVGIGVLYLSLWGAFQLYHLIPAGAAFAAMVFVTAATTFLALQQDAEVLAAFALLGGFATPFLVSTGQNHEVVLFSYVALLDVATIAMVAFKPWRRIVAGAFAGTLVMYVGWYGEYYSKQQLQTTLAFASVFFAIFAASVLVASRTEAERAGASTGLPKLVLLLPLANAAVFFLEAYVMLEETNPSTLAWFALALAAVCLGLSRAAAAGRSEIERRDLRLLHIALAVGFISVAIPLKLERHWITIGWFVEAGALFWVGRRTASNLLLVLATGSLVLGVFRLLALDNFHTTTLIFNSRFATYLVAIAVLALLARYGTGLPEDENAGRGIAVVAINVLAIVALMYEISDTFSRAIATAGGGDRHALWIARDFSYSALWMVYGAALMFAGFWKRVAFLRWQALILFAAAIVKVFVYDVSQLEKGYRILSFIALGVLLLAISFAYQRDWLKLSGKAAPDQRAAV